MTIALTNASGRCLVYVLPHDPYCFSVGQCECARAGRGGNLRVAQSLTIATALTVSGLPDAVLEVADVARAVRRGDLRVVAARPQGSAAPRFARRDEQ